MSAQATDIAGWLTEQDDICAVTHMHPDGDALGASLALVLALEKAGKRAFVLCQDETPSYLDMLPHAGRLFTPDNMPFPPKAVLLVDMSSPSRAGKAASVCEDGLPTACVDHHLTENCPIEPAFIDHRAAAAGQLAAQVIDALDIPVTGDIALCLFVAISTDTMNFAFDSVSGETLRLAARCVDAGVDIASLNYRLFREKSVQRTKLLGRALDRMQLHGGGRIALMLLRQPDFADCAASMQDTEGVVNYGIDATGVEIAILAVELPDGAKFSLRSKDGVDVAAILRPLGGGGHAKAAGVTLTDPFDKATDTVLTAAIKALK